MEVFEDDLFWVSTTDYSHDSHDSSVGAAAAALLTMNKFSRSVHSDSVDVLALCDDLRTELIVAHPALQIPGPVERLEM